MFRSVMSSSPPPTKRARLTAVQHPRPADLNPQCEICKDFASGRHYGVFACEGCKGFFRRTVLAAINIKEPGNYEEYKGYKNLYTCNLNQCQIVFDGNRRKCCKSCRFKRCIDAGMNYVPPTSTKSNSTGYEPWDHSIHSRTVDFQLEIYESYRFNIREAASNFHLFLSEIIPESQKQQEFPEISSMILIEHLRILSQNTLRRFVSSIEIFRSFSIKKHSEMITDTNDQFLCIILVMTFASLEKSIVHEFWRIFNNHEFQNYFEMLQEKLKCIGDIQVKIDEIEIDSDKHNEQFCQFIAGDFLKNCYRLCSKIILKKLDQSKDMKGTIISIDKKIEAKKDPDPPNDKKILYDLKQEHRFLPVFMAFLLMQNTFDDDNKKPREKIGELLKMIICTENRFFYNSPNATNNNETIVSECDLFYDFQDIARILSRMTAIIRLKHPPLV